MGYLMICNIVFMIPKQLTIQLRNLNTSTTQLAVKNAVSKQGKIFNKLFLGSSQKKRKFIFDESTIPSNGKTLNFGHHLKNVKENSRRIAVLNSLFMKHISDLLVMGNTGADILDKGLEISRVSMNPDFSQLNVFWGCHIQENIEDLENILPNISYRLRHELSQLRVVGVVPRILFIKDKHYTNGAKVDYLLSVADFGDDQISSGFESNPIISTSPEKGNEIASNNATSCETSHMEEEGVMPAMRHDVFNLDHQLIMNKILKKKLRSRAIHRFEPNLVIESDGKGITTPNVQGLNIMTKEERREALAKFILTRKILEDKKKQNKHKKDEEIYAEQEDEFEVEEEDYVGEDYIDEDFEDRQF